MEIKEKNFALRELCKDLQGKKALVLGAGASGISAAKFLRKRGAVVGMFDDRKHETLKEAIFVHDEAQADTEDFDFCVISPGVSINHPVAQKFGGRIVSELALGFTAKHKKIIAVTGTNGKTSVTKMIGAAMQRRCVVCGNIGVPVTSVSSGIAKKTAVTEVSSFMMEADGGFKPSIAVILNITQDHLERHGSISEYICCKARLCNADKVILNYDDLNCRVLNDGRAFYYSVKSRVRGIFLDGENIILNIKKRAKVIFRLKEFREDRPHQISNILAVVLVCSLLGVKRKQILEACMGGHEREHRIQPACKVGSVAFVNDSKATNIAASLAACACFKSPVNLLLGGITKGQNFDELFTNIPNNVDHVFAFGVGADEIFSSAGRCEFNNITKCKTMREAVCAAFVHGFGPRVVLLSPACSSFDEFANYAERGKAFMEIVKEIAAANEHSYTNNSADVKGTADDKD